MLKYLTHLIDCQLTCSSLKVRLIALVAYTRGHIGRRFFTAPVIKRFLEGAKRIAPPKKVSAPTWNLNVVLTHLMKAPFEPLHKAILKMPTLKTAFLVVIPSLRRVGETQALAYQEQYLQVHKERIIMRTDSQILTKEVSHFHINQSIQIPRFFKKPRERYTH